MSEGVNRVFLLGNLGEDAELRTTHGGQSICKMRLACSESYLDKDKVRQERTEWVNVVIFGKRGEALGKILTKGSRIFVEGSLRTSSYDDRDGNKRYKTEVIASNVVLNGGGKGKREGDADAPPESGRSGGGGGRSGGGGYSRKSDDSDGGNRGGGHGGGGAKAPRADTPPDDGGYGNYDDEIPFISSRPNAWGL